MRCTCGHLQAEHRAPVYGGTCLDPCVCPGFEALDPQPLLCACGRALLAETGDTCFSCEAFGLPHSDPEATLQEQAAAVEVDRQLREFDEQLESSIPQHD